VDALTPTHHADGFGTLDSPVHRRARAAVEYRRPRARRRQSLDAFEEGSVTVTLPGSKASKDCFHVRPGQRYPTLPARGS
jgi:hypothetical protein